MIRVFQRSGLEISKIHLRVPTLYFYSGVLFYHAHIVVVYLHGGFAVVMFALGIVLATISTAHTVASVFVGVPEPFVTHATATIL